MLSRKLTPFQFPVTVNRVPLLSKWKKDVLVAMPFAFLLVPPLHRAVTCRNRSSVILPLAATRSRHLKCVRGRFLQLRRRFGVDHHRPRHHSRARPNQRGDSSARSTTQLLGATALDDHPLPPAHVGLVGLLPVERRAAVEFLPVHVGNDRANAALSRLGCSLSRRTGLTAAKDWREY